MPAAKFRPAPVGPARKEREIYARMPFVSSEDHSQQYKTTIYTDGHVHCTCDGFRFREDCKHVEALLEVTFHMLRKLSLFFIVLLLTCVTAFAQEGDFPRDPTPAYPQNGTVDQKLNNISDTVTWVSGQVENIRNADKPEPTGFIELEGELTVVHVWDEQIQYLRETYRTAADRIIDILDESQSLTGEQYEQANLIHNVLTDSTDVLNEVADELGSYGGEILFLYQVYEDTVRDQGALQEGANTAANYAYSADSDRDIAYSFFTGTATGGNYVSACLFTITYAWPWYFNFPEGPPVFYGVNPLALRQHLWDMGAEVDSLGAYYQSNYGINNWIISEIFGGTNIIQQIYESREHIGQVMDDTIGTAEQLAPICVDYIQNYGN